MIRRSLVSATTLAALIAVLLIAQAPAAGQAQSPATKAAGACAISRTAMMAAKVVVEARERRIMGASIADLVIGLLA